MLHALGSGWHSLITGYVLTAIGLWLGMGTPGQKPQRLVVVAVASVPVMVAVAAVWSILPNYGLIRRLPEDLGIAVGFVFFVAANALVGFVLVRVRQGEVTLLRGTALSAAAPKRRQSRTQVGPRSRRSPAR
jgi:hypothetical protein